MTDIQVKYQNLQESIRHNKAMEKLGAQSNAIANEQAAANWKRTYSEAVARPFEVLFKGIGTIGKIATDTAGILFE